MRSQNKVPRNKTEREGVSSNEGKWSEREEEIFEEEMSVSNRLKRREKDEEEIREGDLGIDRDMERDRQTDRQRE